MPRPSSQLRVSWDRDLDAYLKAQGGTPSAASKLSTRLADAVRKDCESPEAWWAFLQQEESVQSSSTATLTQSGRGGVGLFDLYHWATKLVPRQSNYRNEAYVKIWLGYARQQWCVSGSVPLQGKQCMCRDGAGHARVYMHCGLRSRSKDKLILGNQSGVLVASGHLSPRKIGLVDWAFCQQPGRQQVQQPDLCD